MKKYKGISIVISFLLIMSFGIAWFLLFKQNVLKTEEGVGEENGVLLEESFVDTSLNQFYGEIVAVEETQDGKIITLSVDLPRATDSFSPEEYEQLDLMNFPSEVKQYLFYVEEREGISFKEGDNVTISFYGDPSETSSIKAETIEFFEE